MDEKWNIQGGIWSLPVLSEMLFSHTFWYRAYKKSWHRDRHDSTFVCDTDAEPIVSSCYGGPPLLSSVRVFMELNLSDPCVCFSGLERACRRPIPLSLSYSDHSVFLVTGLFQKQRLKSPYLHNPKCDQKGQQKTFLSLRKCQRF